LYGSGFPKSLDVSKAIDKAAGAEREVIGTWKPTGKARLVGGKNPNGIYQDYETATTIKESVDITAPSTPEAQTWQGWGTALKPAFEPVIVARKPIEGTVANNVLKWGTGGLNIDGSRIAGEIQSVPQPNTKGGVFSGELGRNGIMSDNTQGRWPANIILDPYTAELLDEQSGQTVSRPTETGGYFGESNSVMGTRIKAVGSSHNDKGGASRFFYVAKASKRDRNEGLDDLDAQRHSDRELADGVGGDNPRNRTNQAKQNFHPTVKPTSLMEYLIKLVTPPNGTVLDPFTGSGSTGKAAILQGFDFIGIEMTEEYLPIIEGRLKHAEHIVAERNKEASLLEQEKLF
jgi:site-specific DNA-methyltransferase (adenine-specific)